MPLGKREDLGDARFAGLETSFASDVETSLASVEICGFDFVVSPLAHPDRRPVLCSGKEDGSLVPPFSTNEVIHTMYSSQLSNQIVGSVSTWIDPDAEDGKFAAESTLALEQELSWASHMTVQACILPPPPRGVSSFNYFRAVNHAVIHGIAPSGLWIRIPLICEGETGPSSSDFGTESSQGHEVVHSTDDDPWEWWNALRQSCSHKANLGVVLDVGKTLPSDLDLVRWKGEPVRAISLHVDAFLSNRKGYPVLSRRHQGFLGEALNKGIQIILATETGGMNEEENRLLSDFRKSFGKTLPAALLNADLKYGISSNPSISLDPPLPPCNPPPQGPNESGRTSLQSEENPNYADEFPALGDTVDTSWVSDQSKILKNTIKRHPLRHHWEYLSYVFRHLPSLSITEIMEAPYRDYLQAPLQPLQDNLESQTYETFERDSIKYDVYQEAIRVALSERRIDSEDVTVIMVVGAGRGPLVTAALVAAREAKREVRVYALDKNPNAIVHMHNRATAERWSQFGHVEIVHADMRNWKPPEKADMLVSELLGSFGDNELSPECLDGAERFLKADGISIPSSYTSYLQPITTQKLWSELASRDSIKEFETPFVVKLHKFAPLSPPQSVFSFCHPNNMSNTDTLLNENSRETKLRFVSAVSGGSLCHGLAGYFEAELYKSTKLSIHPDTHTPAMSSWFPIFFPFKIPIYFPHGGMMEVSMWRKCAPGRVWYEWMAQAVDNRVKQPRNTCRFTTEIHNPDGRSYFVGL